MITLSRVLNHMDGVETLKVNRWAKYSREHRTRDSDPIWTGEALMAEALAVVDWASGSRVPTAAEVLAHVPTYQAYWDAAQRTHAKTDLEQLLRTDPGLKAKISLDARAENKTVDEIIAETVAKI